MSGFALRAATAADLPAITAIYGHWVGTGLTSFELESPDLAEMTRRHAALLAQGYPYLVAEGEGRVLGYAYAGPYRARPAYRFTCENSVYVAPDAQGRGLGRALLAALIERAEQAGLRLMVAVIGDSANAGSIGLHTGLGFSRAGLLPAVGWKFGRWVDSVLMALPLGAGATTPPE